MAWQVRALKDFVEAEGGGRLPLSGAVPDMAASTAAYTQLQQLYRDKALEDRAAVRKRWESGTGHLRGVSTPGWKAAVVVRERCACMHVGWVGGYRVEELLESVGRPKDSIPVADVAEFCRNAYSLQAVRTRCGEAGRTGGRLMHVQAGCVVSRQARPHGCPQWEGRGIDHLGLVPQLPLPLLNCPHQVPGGGADEPEQ